MRKNNIKVLLILMAMAGIVAMFFLLPGKENQNSDEVIPRNYLIVVNISSPYDFNGVYEAGLHGDLAVTKNDSNGKEEFLEYKTLEAFSKLRSAARKKGIEIALLSGYRSEEDQRYRYEYMYQERPGSSEHHTGLNLTIGLNQKKPNGEGPYILKEGDEIPENEELTELLPDFGFIRRYPEGKEDLTGRVATPSEIRYVGDPEIAHAITKHNLCLEEYTGTAKNACG